MDLQVLSRIMSHNLWVINYSSITVMLNWIFVKVFLLMKFLGWHQCLKIWLPNVSSKIRHQHISVSKLTKWPFKLDYSHAGNIVMLMTYSWWQFKYVDDGIKILVTYFGCWCPTLRLRDRWCWWPKHLQTVTNTFHLLHLSPTSM